MLEKPFTGEHFVKNKPAAPDITFFGKVLWVHQVDFRAGIERSSFGAGHHEIFVFSGKSEIADF